MWKRVHQEMAACDKFTKLGFHPMTLWTMMLPHSDMKGRYWAKASWIKGQVLTVFDDLRLEQVESALTALSDAGLIHLYDVDGKRYLVYHDHEDSNPTGALGKVSPKWPEPPLDLCKCVSENGARTAVERCFSPLSLSTSQEGVQGEEERDAPDSFGHRLYRLAKRQKLRAVSDRQLRTYVDGWLASKGFQYCEEVISNSLGADVLDVNTKHFRVATKDAKAAEFKARRDANGPPKI